MSLLPSNSKDRLNKALEHLKTELGQLRTGRASPGLVEHILVEAYGTKAPLIELASITVPEARQLVIQPWDANSLGDIELAIRNSEIGINPTNDGRVIRLSLPPMTAERREELVKILHQKLESGRVMIRAARAKAKKDIERQKNQQDVSEDDITNSLRELDDQIKTILEKLEDLGRKKEVDLLTI